MKVQHNLIDLFFLRSFNLQVQTDLERSLTFTLTFFLNDILFGYTLNQTWYFKNCLNELFYFYRVGTKTKLLFNMEQFRIKRFRDFNIFNSKIIRMKLMQEQKHSVSRWLEWWNENMTEHSTENGKWNCLSPLLI